jgi:hypothetical protein
MTIPTQLFFFFFLILAKIYDFDFDARSCVLFNHDVACEGTETAASLKEGWKFIG